MDPEILFKLLLRAPKLSGVYYRAITADRAKHGTVLSNEGSLLTGGRFNIRNEFGALYLSSDWKVAVEESINTGKRAGFIRFKPKTIVAIEIQSLNVLDLENPSILQELDLSYQDFNEDWTQKNKIGDIAISQIIGRVAREVGFEVISMKSILNPSAINLAILINEPPESKVRVIYPDRLPE